MLRAAAWAADNLSFWADNSARDQAPRNDTSDDDDDDDDDDDVVLVVVVDDGRALFSGNLPRFISLRRRRTASTKRRRRKRFSVAHRCTASSSNAGSMAKCHCALPSPSELQPSLSPLLSSSFDTASSSFSTSLPSM